MAAVAAAQGLSATALAAVEALGESLGHRWTQEERVRAAAVAWCSVADFMVNFPASPHRQPEHLTPYLAIAQGLSEKADFWPSWAPKGGLDEATKWEAEHPQQWSAEQARAIREGVALMESMALDTLLATDRESADRTLEMTSPQTPSLSGPGENSGRPEPNESLRIRWL